MLKEIKRDDNDNSRSWFMSDDLDLIVFFNAKGRLQGFQFCYDKNKHEQVLSWDEDKGYSQEEFAAIAEFDRAYYGAIERGERNVSAINLIRIAKHLKVEVGELFPKIRSLD